MSLFFTQPPPPNKVDVEISYDEKRVYIEFQTDFDEETGKRIRAHLEPNKAMFYVEMPESSRFGMFLYSPEPWRIEVSLPVAIQTAHYQLTYKNRLVDAVFDRAPPPGVAVESLSAAKKLVFGWKP